MVRNSEVDQVVSTLRVSLGLLMRRLRAAKGEGELSLPETSALARLDRDGPSTVTALAKLEQISAQSMGATLAALEARGLVERVVDPEDGRRAFISLSDAGLHVLRKGRNERTERLTRALSSAFTAAELKTLLAAAPLLERLAQNI